MTTENRFRVPQKLWDIAEKKAKEYGQTVEEVICDAAERYLGCEEMVTVEIPKSLYDRVDTFGFVDKVIVSELKEWVEIMEDEQRLAEENSEVRFKIYWKLNALVPHCEVINSYEEDRDNDFVGTFQDIVSKESFLTIASEGYGILEDEIEFIEENVCNSY